MNGPGRVRRRFFLLLAPLVCASVALPAARTDAAESGKLAAAEVAEALSTIQIIAGDVVSAGANKAKAVMIAEGIEPIWSRIEGTIKANDAKSYETLEHGIEGLEEAAAAGDPAKAGASAKTLASAVKAYVAKFPGDGQAAPSAAAPSSGERTAAAASTTAPPESEASAPAPAEDRTAAAADTPADTPAAAEGGTLARTGATATLTALAGAAFGLGGLSVMAGARRRRVPPTA